MKGPTGQNLSTAQFSPHVGDSRRRFVATLLTSSLAIMTGQLLNGCAAHRERRKKCREQEMAAQSDCAAQFPRRFFVSSHGPVGVNGVAGSFARELTAAINTVPNCSAILLPNDFPIDAPPDMPPGPSPQLLRFIESAGSSMARDELLIVHLTEVVAFRPIRIAGILERRSLADGITISREHRTWNAPVDVEPLSPNPFNRRILSHPPPLGATEAQEMNRLSPLAFQQTVAVQVARELAQSPL